MESEKVKEIKNWLEEESEVYRNEIACRTLDLIDELESERNEVAINNHRLALQITELLGEKMELKDRIAELEEYIKGNEQDAKAFVNGWHKDLETELKQFAERLKEKSQKSFINVGGLTASAKTVTLHDIGETLKECINGKQDNEK